MKKLISLLAALGLGATGASTVISCGDDTTSQKSEVDNITDAFHTFESSQSLGENDGMILFIFAKDDKNIPTITFDETSGEPTSHLTDLHGENSLTYSDLSDVKDGDEFVIFITHGIEFNSDNTVKDANLALLVTDKSEANATPDASNFNQFKVYCQQMNVKVSISDGKYSVEEVK